MKKRTLLQRMKSMDMAETTAAVCVSLSFIFFLLILYVGIEWLRRQGPQPTLFQGALSNLSLALVAMPAALFCAISVGGRIASKLLPRILIVAVSATLVMRDFGFYSVDEFYNFVRQHGLRVYRVEKRISGEEVENLRCFQEPLFHTKLFYSPFARESYYAKNLLYLEKNQVEAVIAQTVKPLARFRPEIVVPIVNEEAKEKIQALQKEIESLNKKLSDINRSEGPFKIAAKHRLFLIAQLFIALHIFSQSPENSLTTDGNENNALKIKDINKSYKAFVKERSGLKKLLSELKPDTKHNSFHEDISELIRISMEPGKVSWGGNTKTSLRNNLAEIMTKKERADFEELYAKVSSTEANTEKKQP